MRLPVAQGEACDCLFYIEEGECEIFHSARRADKDFVSDSEVRSLEWSADCRHSPCHSDSLCSHCCASLRNVS